jgi:hypothetical protein
MGSSPISLIQMKKYYTKSFIVADGMLFLGKKDKIVQINQKGENERHVPLNEQDKLAELVAQYPSVYFLLTKTLQDNKQIKSSYLMGKLSRSE